MHADGNGTPMIWRGGTCRSGKFTLGGRTVQDLVRAELFVGAVGAGESIAADGNQAGLKANGPVIAGSERITHDGCRAKADIGLASAKAVGCGAGLDSIPAVTAAVAVTGAASQDSRCRPRGPSSAVLRCLSFNADSEFGYPMAVRDGISGRVNGGAGPMNCGAAAADQADQSFAEAGTTSQVDAMGSHVLHGTVRHHGRGDAHTAAVFHVATGHGTIGCRIREEAGGIQADPACAGPSDAEIADLDARSGGSGGTIATGDTDFPTSRHGDPRLPIIIKGSPPHDVAISNDEPALAIAPVNGVAAVHCGAD